MTDATVQLLETIIKFSAGVAVVFKVIDNTFKQFSKKDNKEILDKLEAVKRDFEAFKNESANWRQAVIELKKDFDLLYEKIIEKAFK